MHLPWLLAAIPYLSASVNAFVPYTIELELSADSSSNSPERRFVPWSLTDGLQDDVESSAGEKLPATSKTFELRRFPVLERRNNRYKIVRSDNSSEPNTVPFNQDGNDLSYVSAVQVGSKNQSLWMMLDTGGANTWLYASDCSSKTCQVHNTFGEAASASLQMSGDKWKVGYGTGTVSGLLGSDSLSIANISVDMTFGLASEASDELQSYPMDGILGLGRASKGVFGHDSFMDAVAKQKLLSSNVIGFSLSRGSAKVQDGSVTFGGVDDSKFTGDISYTDTVGSKDHWSIPLDDATVDGAACSFSGRKAFLDTGTSYMLIPPDDAKVLNGKIPGATPQGERNHIIPCNTSAEIQFSFSGVNYTISPKDYVGSKSGSGCVSTIIGHAMFGDDVWLVGDVFLKNVYTVFDYDQNRIGLAKRAYPGDKDSNGDDDGDDGEDNSDSNSDSNSNSNSKSDSDSDDSSATSTATSTGSSASETDASGGAANIVPRVSWLVATLLCVVGLGMV
ncbi:acid protease [Aspergillus steynii IBT 23096]|uniref:Acid protease n=1 Tax=Aspergillus steynii IBT 23096 TaxID=1392250 RepID=A0A2I2GNI0_9EURO|nr:acid protease [Aspergillus steynii IBT 23096]PLB54423.1 acid protease [Aspergillus steynii IBT 23096]